MNTREAADIVDATIYAAVRQLGKTLQVSDTVTETLTLKKLRDVAAKLSRNTVMKERIYCLGKYRGPGKRSVLFERHNSIPLTDGYAHFAVRLVEYANYKDSKRFFRDKFHPLGMVFVNGKGWHYAEWRSVQRKSRIHRERHALDECLSPASR